MRRLFEALALLILLSGCGSREDLQSTNFVQPPVKYLTRPPHGMGHVVWEDVVWVAKHFPRDVELKALSIGFLSSDEMQWMYYEERLDRAKEGGEELPTIIGLYYKENQVLVLLSSFWPADLQDRATLVHEIVHYFQDMAGVSGGGVCMGLTEPQAYRLQMKWCEEHGIDCTVTEQFIRSRVREGCL